MVLCLVLCLAQDSGGAAPEGEVSDEVGPQLPVLHAEGQVQELLRGPGSDPPVRLHVLPGRDHSVAHTPQPYARTIIRKSLLPRQSTALIRYSSGVGGAKARGTDHERTNVQGLDYGVLSRSKRKQDPVAPGSVGHLHRRDEQAAAASGRGTPLAARLLAMHAGCRMCTIQGAAQKQWGAPHEATRIFIAFDAFI